MQVSDSTRRVLILEMIAMDIVAKYLNTAESLEPSTVSVQSLSCHLSVTSALFEL